MKRTPSPRLFVVMGGPGSGKDALIRATRDLGSLHATIIPKHTSRLRRPDDGSEMICKGDTGWNLDKCNLRYRNFGDEYGLQTEIIWRGLATGISQVAVVSNIDAINRLRQLFADLVVLLYVHSEVTKDAYISDQKAQTGIVDNYLLARASDYAKAFRLYVANMLHFHHVLIYSGAQEDMFDQLFRLFRHYERRA